MNQCTTLLQKLMKENKSDNSLHCKGRKAMGRNKESPILLL